MDTLDCSHGEFWVKSGFQCDMSIPCVLGSEVEPVFGDLIFARPNSHSVVAWGDGTTIPLAAGKAREDATILRCGCLKAMQSIGSSTRIGRADQAAADCLR